MTIAQETIVEKIRLTASGMPQSILDVEATGFIGECLGVYDISFPRIEALQSSAHEIDRLGLHKLYTKVYNVPVKSFVELSRYTDMHYDVIVMDNVVQNMFKSEAMDVLEYFAVRCNVLFFSTTVDVQSNHVSLWSEGRVSGACNFNYRDSNLFIIDNLC